jgi:hypothetical protein
MTLFFLNFFKGRFLHGKNLLGAGDLKSEILVKTHIDIDMNEKFFESFFLSHFLSHFFESLF